MESSFKREGQNTVHKENLEIPSHNIVKLEEWQFIEAVKKDFDLEVTDLEKVTSGWANQVYKASLNGETIFIRMNKKTEVFPVEILGYELFEQQNIPVPEVIAYQEHPQSIGYPTMILSAAEGIDLVKAKISPEQEEKIYEQVGEILRKINEIKLDGYGALEVKDGKLKGKFDNWKDSWMSSEEHFYKDAEILNGSSLITPEEFQKLEEVYREIGSLDFGQASLLHRDVHSTHIFIKGDKVTGIIDLGRLEAGDPRYDIAMSLLYQNNKRKEAFKKGYGDLADDPMVTKYILSIAAMKIAFRFKNKLTDSMEEALRVFKEAFKKLTTQD